jgi:hypothetical protein
MGQADICHSYQVLVSHGFNKEKWVLAFAFSFSFRSPFSPGGIHALRVNAHSVCSIIVMMYDDLAHNSENPTPGVVINAVRLLVFSHTLSVFLSVCLSSCLSVCLSVVVLWLVAVFRSIAGAVESSAHLPRSPRPAQRPRCVQGCLQGLHWRRCYSQQLLERERPPTSICSVEDFPVCCALSEHTHMHMHMHMHTHMHAGELRLTQPRCSRVTLRASRAATARC